jgi:hypothetical protein
MDMPDSTAAKLRKLIAAYLGVDASRVADEAHLSDDLYRRDPRNAANWRSLSQLMRIGPKFFYRGQMQRGRGFETAFCQYNDLLGNQLRTKGRIWGLPRLRRHQPALQMQNPRAVIRALGGNGFPISRTYAC